MENKEELKRRAEEIAENVRYSNHEKSGGKNTFAYILIILGVFFLLNNMGFFDYIDLFRFWPMILVVFGLLIIFNND